MYVPSVPFKKLGGGMSSFVNKTGKQGRRRET